MLTDIYARSMMTAARQDCVRLRDLPPAKPLPRAAGVLERLAAWLHRRPVKTRCIKPQNI